MSDEPKAESGVGESLAARLARLDRASTTVLTHYGRKTGKAFKVTIWFTVDEDHVNLQTMNMDRQWTRNVLANGKVSLKIGDQVLEGEASQVTDSAQMKRIADLMKKKYWIARPYLWIKKQPDGAFQVRIVPGSPAARS
ncbi:MAG: nitroreductase/quinone reductase family protein [Polyangiaceae bacterium]|jgi:deazaflavin-dependent oxidoreductase (nitroreductase family)